MRKFFLFVAAMMFAFAANAKVINITPTSPKPADNLRLALDSAAAGDVIVMAEGIYDESNGDYIAFNKDITVMAAEGAEVIVRPKVCATVSNGARAEIINIQWEADSLHVSASWYPAIFYISAAGANKLILNGCELSNSPKYMIYCSDAGHLDSCVINNSFIHDGNNSAIWMQKHAAGEGAVQACDHLIITNSTFANVVNIEYPLIRVENIGGTETSDVEIKVDHCTFYNHTKNAELTYGFIDSRKSTNNLVSNCIFVNPQIPEGQFNAKATQLYGGTILKCMRWNVPAHRLSVAEGNDIEADPLFKDAAKLDFTLADNSPAIGAGTDGSNLGDPFWWPKEELPQIQIIGGMNGWSGNDIFTPAEDGLSASLKLNLTTNNETGYPFKLNVGNPPAFNCLSINNGTDKYGFHRGNTTAKVTYISETSEPMWITVDVDGEYIFTWTYADSTLTIAFPEKPEPKLANGYYLMGTQVEWKAENLTAAYKFAENPAKAGEYMLDVTLAKGDSVKVIYLEDDAIKTWYGNNNYPITEENAGDLTIYFNPNGGQDGWFDGYLYVEKKEGSAIDLVETDSKAVKFIENGQLFILKNGIRYNVLGAVIR